MCRRAGSATGRGTFIDSGRGYADFGSNLRLEFMLTFWLKPRLEVSSEVSAAFLLFVERCLESVFLGSGDSTLVAFQSNRHTSRGS